MDREVCVGFHGDGRGLDSRNRESQGPRTPGLTLKGFSVGAQSSAGQMESSLSNPGLRKAG